MNIPISRFHARFLAALFVLGTADAQTQPSTPARSAGGPGTDSTSIVMITANPLRLGDTGATSAVLTGDDLLRQRGTTLGETLATLPGVAQATFGPNASRPVVRGQDGDRIRLLSNSGASLDASALSADHAVALDPLAVERIEVLRGPAALLYGGSAAGGVVNVIDNRIPADRVGRARAVAETRLGGAAGERSASLLAETDALGLTWHADGFARRTQDLRVPAFDPDGGGPRRRVLNSDAATAGAALGASWISASGHAGLSFDTHRNDYGVVVDPDTRIRLRRDRLALAGEWRPGAVSPVPTVRWQAAHQDYRHDEIEGSGTVGTRFRHRGEDARVEATHAAVALAGGRLEGAFGVQFDASRLSALGEEAFVPSTDTRQTGIFVVENWRTPSGAVLTAGVRADRVRVASDGDAPDAPVPHFGASTTRTFDPAQQAVGAALPLGPALTLTLNAARTERAPTSYELFARGVHVATGNYERGDATLEAERGRGVDAGLRWRSRGGTSASGIGSELQLNVFANRYSRYLLLLPATEPPFVDGDGRVYPVQAFVGVRARLRGGEMQWRHAFTAAGAGWEIGATADWIRGTNPTGAEPLPRLPPWRAGAHAQWQRDGWRLRAGVRHAGAQERVPSNETVTPGWTQWDASVQWDGRWGGVDVQVFLRGVNLTNALAFNAVATAPVRSLSPLPGRSLLAGLRATL